MSVSVLTVRALLAELTRQGYPTDDLIAAAGLSEETLRDPRQRLAFPHFHQLTTEAYARTSDPALGLRAGLHAPLSALGVLGPLLLAATSLRDALEQVQRYLPLLEQGATWQLSEAQECATISLTPARERGHGTRFITEYAFAMAARIGDDLSRCARGERQEVRFAHSAPANAAEYADAFHCPVRFGARDYAIVLPRRRIDEPQLHADPWVQSALTRTAEQLLCLLAGTRVADRIRAYLGGQAELRNITVHGVSAAFPYTPRTLRRRLAAEGTSLSEILDEVRAERARAELLAPEVSLKAVAIRLGFASVTAFHRAFRRWTGSTPSAFAEANRADERAKRI
jgi:AraC-like DNA-binding protein